mmetsp:Transcript_22392/g.47280  ORF Transcript_22392/g.47280 Transcript_22392/m.47280 type:complete len:302 (+) Transcript_22392:867-1772(+)
MDEKDRNRNTPELNCCSATRHHRGASLRGDIQHVGVFEPGIVRPLQEIDLLPGSCGGHHLAETLLRRRGLWVHTGGGVLRAHERGLSWPHQALPQQRQQQCGGCASAGQLVCTGVRTLCQHVFGAGKLSLCRHHRLCFLCRRIHGIGVLQPDGQDDRDDHRIPAERTGKSHDSKKTGSTGTRREEFCVRGRTRCPPDLRCLCPPGGVAAGLPGRAWRRRTTTTTKRNNEALERHNRIEEKPKQNGTEQNETKKEIGHSCHGIDGSVSTVFQIGTAGIRYAITEKIARLRAGSRSSRKGVSS